MTGEKIFLDTNIIIYAHSHQDLIKQRIVRETILANDFMISTHVIDEFYNICSKRLHCSIAATNQKVDFLLDNYPVVPVYSYTDKMAIFFQELGQIQKTSRRGAKTPRTYPKVSPNSILIWKMRRQIENCSALGSISCTLYCIPEMLHIKIVGA